RVLFRSLIDAEQVSATQQINGVLVAECSDQRGVFDERAEVLPTRGHCVVDRREQVGFADTEAAVQIDTGLELWFLLLPAPEESRLFRSSTTTSEPFEQFFGFGLRRKGIVRAVALEGGARELRRRDEAGQHLRTGHDRFARGEVRDGRTVCFGHALPMSNSYASVPKRAERLYG